MRGRCRRGERTSGSRRPAPRLLKSTVVGVLAPAPPARTDRLGAKFARRLLRLPDRCRHCAAVIVIIPSGNEAPDVALALQLGEGPLHRHLLLLQARAEPLELRLHVRLHGRRRTIRHQTDEPPRDRSRSPFPACAGSPLLLPPPPPNQPITVRSVLVI